MFFLTLLKWKKTRSLTRALAGPIRPSHHMEYFLLFFWKRFSTEERKKMNFGNKERPSIARSKFLLWPVSPLVLLLFTHDSSLGFLSHLSFLSIPKIIILLVAYSLKLPSLSYSPSFCVDFSDLKFFTFSIVNSTTYWFFNY